MACKYGPAHTGVYSISSVCHSSRSGRIMDAVSSLSKQHAKLADCQSQCTNKLTQVISALEEISVRGQSQAPENESEDARKNSTEDEEVCEYEDACETLQHTEQRPPQSDTLCVSASDRDVPGCPMNRLLDPVETVQTRLQTTDPAALDSMLHYVISRQKSAVVSLHMQIRRCDTCPETCHCNCHSQRRWEIPRVLQKFLGALFVGYQGFSFRRPKCNLASCHGTWARTVTATYTFPRWFAAQSLHFAFESCSGQPSFGLFVQRRTSRFEENSIFQLAAQGNHEGIIANLDHGRAAPNDATADLSGFTALHVCSLSGCVSF